MGGSVRGGVSAQGGVYTSLWTEFLTHACENITFPQLRLGTVITQSCNKMLSYCLHSVDNGEKERFIAKF